MTTRDTFVNRTGWLEFLPYHCYWLLTSIVMYVIFLPSPSPVANVHCAGTHPTDNERPSTLRSPPRPRHPHPITFHSRPSQTFSTLAAPPVSKSLSYPEAENRTSIPPNKIHLRTTNHGMNATSECCKPTGYGLSGFRVR